MKSAKSKAVVVKDAVVSHVESTDRSAEAFAEILADGEIESGVGGEIIALVGLAGNAGFSVGKAGAVVDVG